MTTLEFLQRVLPAEGVYCALYIENGTARQSFHDSVGELRERVEELRLASKNVYYAIAAFKDNKRAKSNVRRLKTFALDLDCKEDKGYPNKKAAAQALQKFVSELKLPMPMIVSSGNGLHVYWVLERELEVDEWTPIATALKQAAIQRGFEQDWAVPSDSARVLRPVGTINPIGGKLVEVLLDSPPVDPDLFFNLLVEYQTPVALPGKKLTAPSGLLAAMSVDYEYPPATASVVTAKCQQIGWGVDNQDKVEEPFWYAMMGVAAYCSNPEDTAKNWSKNHPDYSEQATLIKLKQWEDAATGPATCSKFESLRPKGCSGCKVGGNIGTPARLGANHREVDTSQDAPSGAITEIDIPKPFKRTQYGIKRVVDETDIDVCSFDLYPVSYGRDEIMGYETCRFKWHRPHEGWQDLVLRQAHLADGTYRDFITAIADQGVVLENKKQTEYFQMMLRSYMNELRKVRAMTNLYATMGWKDEYKIFVLGDTLYKRTTDGSVSEESIRLAGAGQRPANDMFGERGQASTWTNMTNVLPKADLNAHMFAIGVSLASPLLAFTGLNGMTVSLFGDTGGGKSLAQLMAQSVFGDPTKLHFQAKYTQNTLFSRFGLYSNLPVTIDETTLMPDREVGDFLYWVSQGRDKARLNRNAEERESKTWSTFCMVSTNKSMSGKLIASGLDTDAQMARLLELQVPCTSLFSESSAVGRKLYKLVTDNYGHIGRAFVKKLVEIGEAGIHALIAEATHKFNSRYGVKFTGQERYWEQVLILTDLALRLAHSWGLIKYTPEQCIKWATAQLPMLRKSIADNQIDAFDLIAEYINEQAAETVRVMHTMGDSKPIMDFARVPRGSIHVRIDVYRKNVAQMFDSGTVMLSSTHFRKWLSSKGGDWHSLVSSLNTENANATPKSKKFSLGKHTPIQLPQSYVLGINLSHPRMQALLDQADEELSDLTLGSLQSMDTGAKLN